MILNQSEQPAQAEAGPYDFDYLCRYCGLISVPSGLEAFNPQHVIKLVRRTDEGVTLLLPEGHMIELSAEDTPKMIEIMKAREQAALKWQAERIEREAQLNTQAQLKAAQDAMTQAAMMNKLNRNPRGS